MEDILHPDKNAQYYVDKLISTEVFIYSLSDLRMDPCLENQLIEKEKATNLF